MQTLSDLPAKVDVAWWGKAWDKGCTEDLRIYPPESEFCHRCYDPLGVRSSGVAVRDTDDRWLHYDPACWGLVLWEAEEAARDGLDAEPE